MFIRNSYYALLYRLTALLFIISGILKHLSFSNTTHNNHMFSFFTIQSNLLCMVLFMFLSAESFMEISKEVVYPYRFNNCLLRGTCLCAITVTFIIFQFVLKKTYFSMFSGVNGTISINDIFVHYLTPFFTIFDWVLFEPKGQLHFHHTIYWLIMPVCYFFITMLRGLVINSDYPYFFMDIDTVGIWDFLFYSTILIIVYFIVGIVISSADKILLRLSIR